MENNVEKNISSYLPAWEDRDTMTHLVIPEWVTAIDDLAFSDCDSLTSVEIPEGVTSIGDQAFGFCDSLTSVTIPASVTSIGDYVFEGCDSLPTDENGIQYESQEKKVLIKAPESLAGEFTIPASVKFVHSKAFAYCSSLTSVKIPSSVTSIGDYAFYGCSSLTSAVIPEGVTEIGEGAFVDCDSLRWLKIPNSVTYIDYGAFYECPVTCDIQFSKTRSDVSFMEGYPWGIKNGAVIHCTDGDLIVGELAVQRSVNY